jgi:hypothetical protein
VIVSLQHVLDSLESVQASVSPHLRNMATYEFGRYQATLYVASMVSRVGGYFTLVEGDEYS